MNISLRPIRKDDAERMFNILDNDMAKKYFGYNPTSVSRLRRWIGTRLIKNKKDMAWVYAILDNDNMVGYIEIELGYKDIGWIGYCVDETHWGKGIATRAVTLIEEEVKDTSLTKLGISLSKDNTGSVKVAIKSGYEKDDEESKLECYYKEL